MKEDDPRFKDLKPEDKERVKQGVQYTYASPDLLKTRVAGEDFSGNLTEFSLIFEWRWDGDEEKFLHEKSTEEKFSGWVHIKDDRLDEETYPGQEQRVKFENGSVNAIDSLSQDT